MKSASPLPRRAATVLVLAALACRAAADDNYDHHVTRTESGFSRALSGFFNALGESLEQAERDRAAREAAGEEIIVQVSGQHGMVPVHLRRKGSGFEGPRGEYYSQLPTAAELERTYGRTPPTWSGGGSPAGTQVDRGDGEVTVRQPGRSPLYIRTEGRLVKEWRVNEADGSVSVLSHSSGAEPVVQNFSLRDGRQRDRVLVRDISNGRPAWAAPYGRADGGSGYNTGTRADSWAGTSVRRAPGEVTVEVPGRPPMRIPTAGSVVKEWRVDESAGTVSVLSLVPGGEPVVQNFGLRDGRQLDRVALGDIRNGRPAYAAPYERAPAPVATKKGGSLRLNEPRPDGAVWGPRVTVAGDSTAPAVQLGIWDSRNNRVTDREVPTQNGYWNTQVPLNPGRYRLRAQNQGGGNVEEFWFEVRR